MTLLCSRAAGWPGRLTPAPISYGSAPTQRDGQCLMSQLNHSETHMYIGGGIIGLILVIALILFVLRRI